MLWSTFVCVSSSACLGRGLVINFPWHLGIIVTWSPEDVDVGIQSLLVQIYSILLSTLLSINRQQLSLLDAGFALTLSSSPLTIYLVFTSICNLFGIHTGLYKRIKTYPLIIRTLGALVPLLWTALSMVSGLSPSAFKDSSCAILTFGYWLHNTLIALFASLFAPTSFTVSLVFGPALAMSWCLCLLRILARLEGGFRAPFGRSIYDCAGCAFGCNAHGAFLST
jgi:ribose/xylose/arabinose/galactoside ABC-type transport system permease subunit